MKPCSAGQKNSTAAGDLADLTRLLIHRSDETPPTSAVAQSGYQALNSDNGDPFSVNSRVLGPIVEVAEPRSFAEPSSSPGSTNASEKAGQQEAVVQNLRNRDLYPPALCGELVADSLPTSPCVDQEDAGASGLDPSSAASFPAEDRNYHSATEAYHSLNDSPSAIHFGGGLFSNPSGKIRFFNFSHNRRRSSLSATPTHIGRSPIGKGYMSASSEAGPNLLEFPRSHNFDKGAGDEALSLAASSLAGLREREGSCGYTPNQTLKSVNLDTFCWPLSDAWVQIFIVALIAFGSQGMWNALNALGGAGTSHVKLATTANVINNATFAFLGWCSGGAVNLFGNRWTTAFGTLTCANFLTMFYLMTYYDAVPPWLVLCTSAIDGVGAGILWAAVGAMLIFYPPADRKGRGLSIFFLIFNLGGVIGGIVTAVMNWNLLGSEPVGLPVPGLTPTTETSGAMSSASYLVVVCTVYVTFFVSFLLVHPSKVRRADNETVELPKSDVWEELIGLKEAVFRPEMLRLSLFFVVTLWHEVFLYNWLNFSLFDVRSRGINSAVYWLSRIIFAFVHEAAVDRAGQTVAKRARNGFYLLIVTVVLAMSAAGLIALGLVTEKPDDGTLYDITEVASSWLPFLCFILFGALDTIGQSFVYWLLGVLPTESPLWIPRYAGLFRAYQALGAMLSWSVDLLPGVPHEAQYGICLLIWLLAMPGIWYTVFRTVPSANSNDLDQSAPTLVTVQSPFGLAIQTASHPGEQDPFWRHGVPSGSTMRHEGTTTPAPLSRVGSAVTPGGRQTPAHHGIESPGIMGDDRPPHVTVRLPTPAGSRSHYPRDFLTQPSPSVMSSKSVASSMTPASAYPMALTPSAGRVWAAATRPRLDSRDTYYLSCGVLDGPFQQKREGLENMLLETTDAKNERTRDPEGNREEATPFAVNFGR